MQAYFSGMLCLCLAFTHAAAQPSAVTFGASLGAALYQGDLAHHHLGSFNRPGFSAQALTQLELHPGFALRGYFSFTQISDDEQGYRGYHPYRNFRFKTTIRELSLQLALYPLEISAAEDPPRISPYLTGGAGFAYLRIRRNWSGFNPTYSWQKWVLDGLHLDTTTTLPTHTLLFPMGLGLRVRIGEYFSVYAEAIHRLTQSEYLDGFSKAANPYRNDAFTSFTAGFLVSLGAFRNGYGCLRGGPAKSQSRF